MTFPIFISVALLVCGLGACIQSGRTRSMALLLFCEALVCALLLIAYGIANHFTGEGINTAVWYHVRYGLEGAGFRDYRALIWVSATALLITPLLLAAVVIWRRKQPRRRGFSVFGQVLLVSALITNPGAKDLLALSRSRSPATADFYRHYRPATLTTISSEHPNFVFIYAESLERTYFDEQRFPGLITHLRELEREGTTFTNIRTLEGTGFTMGGMVGSLCGVPLFTPANANSMSGMDAFLPGAVGVPDLLHDQGYFLSFIGGAQLDFAGKKKFLHTHHFDESAGFSELHGKTADPTYISNWGLYDDTMFDFAYERAVQLSEQKRPFGLFLLTLDTHAPEGHISRTATSGPYRDGSNPMLNAVKASDELITRFVERLRHSPAGKNLVVVIVSDHVAMENSASDLLRQGERRNLFLILDPRNPTGTRIDRPGSTLDIGATLLPTLGFKGRINLGRDLRDPATEDSELQHIQNTETLLSWRAEIIRLWDFPQLKYSLAFDPASSVVKIDGRQFQAPVLIELADNGRTTMRFQFDALYESHLAEQTKKLRSGEKFLLVVKPDDARDLLTQGEETEAPWVLVAGRAGGTHITIPLANEISYSKNQIDRFLSRAAPPSHGSASVANPIEEPSRVKE